MIKSKLIRNLSIKIKIVAIILSVTCLVIGIGFTLVTIWSINKQKSDTISDLNLTAKLVGSYCIVPLTFNDRNQAKEALLSLKNINDIEVASLYDKSGNLFASYPDSLSRNTNLELKSHKNNIFHDGYFYVQEPIVFKGELYGTLCIKANSTQLNQARKNLLISFSILIFALIVISYFLALRLQRYISKPILILKNHFDSIAKNQDFTAHIAKQNNDEIGSLYDGFNNLLNQISIKQEERDKAQLLQKESETQLKLITDNFVNGMIYQVATLDDNKRQFNYISEVVNNLYGCTVQEAKDNPDLIYGKLHPDDRNGLIEKEKEALNKMSVFNAEARVTRPDGSIRWAFFISKPRIIKGIVCWDGIEIDITERKQTEMDLAESESKFRSLMEQSPVVVELYDLDGLQISVNKAYEDLWSFPAETTVGKFNLLKSKEVEDSGLMKYVKQAYAGISVNVPDYKFNPTGETEAKGVGRVRWLSTRIYPIINDASEVKNIVIMHLDVTDRILNEKAIKHITERLQFATEGANIGTWHWNTITNELIWSSVCNALFDIPQEEKMNYERFRQALHPDDRERTDEAVKIALDNHTDYNIEYRSVWRDGSVHWLAALGRGYYNENDKNIRMEGVVIDIDTRKRAEEDLLLAQDKLNLALHGGEIGVWEWDFATDLIMWDTKMEKMFGLEVGEFNQNLEAFKACLHPDDVVTTENAIKNAVSGIAPYDAVYRVIWKDKEVKFIHAKGLIVKDNEETPVSMTGICIDVSNIKNAELEIKSLNENLEQRILDRTAQLEAANKELEAFSYSVSHDLRAPLRGVHGFTQILMEDYADKMDDEFKRICTIIWENSHKMGQLIDDLLAFSRLSRSAMRKSTIDMTSMVNSMFHEITTEESRKKITLELDELSNIQGDPALLKQVWANLLSNAIKFSSKKDETIISVTCKMEKEKSVFCISDNGAGFNMKYANKLFGVFQRLHSPKEFEGTGVGLAIVQRIVMRHGGMVWAEGEVDKGAKFYFSLPN